MSLFVVTYTYTSDVGAQARLRPQRYAYFQALEQDGALMASGQLLGAGLGDGLLVLEASDARAAAALLDDDPFVREQLVSQRRIVPWNPTTGAWLDR